MVNVGTCRFSLPKVTVYEAWLLVKANKGGSGIDNESLKDFEGNLKGNLYKIWNRMSSGSYFPPPVKLVDIPKADGGIRTLGIPTVSDRIAQMVVKIILEPLVEPMFHADSYGYRPNKSALDAVSVTRTRCWRHNWVVDLDIKGFFDTIDHSLMMRAVRKHTSCRYIQLYIERWLKAPAAGRDGQRVERGRGTPQGDVVAFTNPKVRGWSYYYGKFGKRAFNDVMWYFKQQLTAWGVGRYKKFKGRFRKCFAWLNQIAERNPSLISCWAGQ
ncbi:MAG: reverse transcriptase [Nitrospinae bacterium]|nr:reverse transcriptase [Nitrospinota bacterium]